MAEQLPSAACSISWLPSWVPRDRIDDLRVGGTGAGEATAWHCARPRLDAWAAIARGLTRAGDALRALPIADIVAAIDGAAARWCDRAWPVRVEARDRAVAATGFAPEVVDRSFDVELRNYRADSLWRALRRELGDPEVLDGPRPDAALAGATMAVGPRITLEIFTGNVPGLPALSLVRGLLVKSAVIAKVASGEPTFAAAFARSLAEREPRLGDALLVTYWDRHDRETLEAVLDHVDTVMVYGSQAACAALRALTRPHQRFIEHGHKLSMGLLSRAYLDRAGSDAVAALVARDACMFNQHACIAPQAYVVEGSTDEVRAFAARVADAMAAYARACPPGRLAPEDAAVLQMRRAAAMWRAATSPRHDTWCPPDLDWTVILTDDLDSDAGGGHRVLRLLPAAGLDDAMGKLRPYGPYLQNMAVGAVEQEMPSAVRALALLGASRICQPGYMAEPSMAWRHDGRMCIAELLRWCDVEMHPWAEPREANPREAGERSQT